MSSHSEHAQELKQRLKKIQPEPFNLEIYQPYSSRIKRLQSRIALDANPKKRPAVHVKDFLHRDNIHFLDTIYRQVLKRQPDQGGLDMHLQSLEAGVPRLRILWIIKTSDEGKLKNGPIPGFMWENFKQGFIGFRPTKSKSNAV